MRGLGLALSGDEEEDDASAPQRRERQRDAIDVRLEARLRAGQRALRVVERRLFGKERRHVPVGTETEEHEIEALERRKLLLVERGALLTAEFAAHAVHGPRSHVVEERTLRKPVVRALVVLRHAALVAPPELGVRPI